VELEDRIRDCLDRLQPPFPDVTPDWVGVERRAEQIRRRDSRGWLRGSAIRRIGLTRGLLIGVAVCVLAAGVAAAASGLFAGGHSLFHRHYPVQHLVATVHFEHGPAPVAVRRVIGDGSAFGFTSSAVRETVDGARARLLARVSLARTPYAFYAVPMVGQRGYCVFGKVIRRGLVEPQQFCTHAAGFLTPWVNQPPPMSNRIPERFAEWGRDANNSKLLAHVGPPLAGYNNHVSVGTLHTATRPVAVWAVIGMIPRGTDRVDVKYQDGTHTAAGINGRFFITVVQGVHARAGHRPVGLVALSRRGGILASQRLFPAAFDIEQYALAQAVDAHILTADLIAGNETEVILHRLNTPNRMSITTSTRVAKVFGGKASDYPPVSAVIFFPGPYIVAKARHHCSVLPAQCTLPAGHYAWLALVMPVGVKLAVPADQLPQAYQRWQRQIRWIKLAPPGTPRPHLALLGPWAWRNR
jgi:hypothetical protein